MVPLLRGEIESLIRAALAEDLGSGDLTTLATIGENQAARARLRARESLVAAGMDLARAAFEAVDPRTVLVEPVPDGRRLEAGATLARVEGRACALLTAERVALNFLQRLSGIATLTAAFTDAVRGTGARILDTRKTTPGWRRLEKYAVRCGGGLNHRQRLDDLALIKDNHLAALGGARPNPIAAAVEAVRRQHPYLRVEVEADTLEQVRQAVEAGADIVLLDNMTMDQLREAVAICRGRARTEASGGIRLETVRQTAEAGVDFISVGALTHSARWVDIGLDFET